MGLKDLIITWCNRPSIAELSRQLAQRSYALVRESVGPEALNFSRAEARGYIRAKAGPVIRAEAKVIAGRYRGMSKTSLTAVVGQASDRVVQSVLGDLNRQRTRPALHRAA